MTLVPTAHAVTFEALVNPNIPESGGSVEVTLRLSATAAETAGGTCTIDGEYFTDEVAPPTVELAIAGEDYEATDDLFSLSLAANSPTDVTTTAVVTIPILGDNLVEATQEGFAFFVDLITPSCFGEVVSDLGLDLVIVDDDALRFAFSPDVSINEDGDVASITIEALNLGNASGGITADLVVSTANISANAGEDYETTSQTITFNQNLGITSFEVPIIDDADVEADETFSISVTSVTATDNGFPVLTEVDPSQTIVTIISDDVAPPITLSFLNDEVRFLENQAFAVVQVAPSTIPTTVVTVDFNSVDGSADSPDDFTGVSGTLTFPVGTADPQSIQVPIINDAVDENNELLSIVLSNPVGADVDTAADTATIIIDDNDTAAGSDVSLTGAPGDTVTFSYTTADASDGRDTQEAFSNVTITGNGPFTVEYTAVIPATAVDGDTFDDAVVIPIDTPPPVDRFITLVVSTAVVPTEYEFVAVSTSADEGDGSVELQIRRTGDTGNSGQVEFRTLVGGSATSGDDFEATSGVALFAPGQQVSDPVSVVVLDDQLVEGDESFDVELFNPVDGTLSTGSSLASVTIIDDDLAPGLMGELQFASAEVSVNESDGTLVLEVARANGSDGAATVEYVAIEDTAIEGEDFVAANGTLSWANGDAEPKTITLDLITDTLVEGIEEFTLVLQNPTGAALGTPAAVTVAITDLGRDIADIPGLSANQKQMAGWFDANCDRLIGSNSNNADQQDLANVCQNLRSVDTSNDQVRNGLDAVNAEELATAATTTLRLLGDQHGNLQRRLNGLRSGAKRGIDMAGLSVSVDGQHVSGAALEEMLHGLTWGAVGEESDFGRWGFFVDGKVDFGDRDSNVANNGYDFDSTLITVGADYRVQDNFFVGGAFGYANADVDFNGGGGLDFDSYRGSVFTTYFPSENYYVDALVSYGTTDYDSARRILYTDSGGTVDRTATGSTDGSLLTAGVGSGFDFARGGLTFGPNFGAYYFHVDVDGYAEGGAGGLNLNIGNQSAKSFTANVGGHASWVINTNWGVLIPNARFDMVHEFQDGVEQVAIRFAADPFSNDPSNPSAPIVVQSERPDENYFVWSVGASAQFVRGFSGFVTYQGTEGYNNLKLNEVSFGMRYEKTF